MDRYQKIAPSMPERLPIQHTGFQREQHMQTRGIERLTREQAAGVAQSFGSQIKAKLEGRESSLAVIPTYLRVVDKEKLQSGDEALVVEVGGTHFRSSIVTLDSTKDPQLVSETLTPESKKKYSSTDEFFDELAGNAHAVVGDAKPKAVGIIWSFPADVQPTSHGIDAVSTDKLTKELVVPGVNNKLLGDFVIQALRKSGMDIPADLPRAVVNDTAAVLVANGATLGGIVATGFNLAFFHNGQIYNLEAGGFTDVPQTALFQAIDTLSEHPGHYPLEKQVSGDYVGQAFSLLLKELGIADKKFTTADMSNVLAGKMLADIPAAKDIAEALRDRSAQLVAAAIAGTIAAFPEDFPSDEIVIPIDGSFFGKTPGYKEAVEFYATDILGNGKKIQCNYVKESGMKGAGLAALAEGTHS